MVFAVGCSPFSSLCCGGNFVTSLGSVCMRKRGIKLGFMPRFFVYEMQSDVLLTLLF